MSTRSATEEVLIAKKSGCRMPRVGFGTWSIGGKKRGESRDLGQDVADRSVLLSAWALGSDHFDTAEKYADGHAERLLGETIGMIPTFPRSKLFLTSKVDVPNMRAGRIREACEATLDRLGTPYLDLYLLHSGTDHVPLEELIRTMDGLVEAGLVRHIGVSNFSRDRLARAHALSAYGISCNQVHYSLVVRDAERSGLLAYCQEEEIPLIAYRGVEKGKMADDPPEVLVRIAKKYGKTPTQIALAWLTSQAMVGALIFTRNAKHHAENLTAFETRLDPEDVELLRRDFPDQVDASPVSPLS